MPAQRIEVVKRTRLNMASLAKRVLVDTSVIPTVIAYPTDSALLECSRATLMKLAQRHRLDLRQNYNRVAPRLVPQAGRNAHAQKYKRMHATSGYYEPASHASIAKSVGSAIVHGSRNARICKVRTSCEFAGKLSIVTALKECLFLGSRSDGK